jgi:DNA-binding transcriptional LysR family regulator
MNWDDLRVARAVFETGSYAAAARRLRINETTVPRRLTRLERDLGVTLFEAADGRRRPTAYCERIVALSNDMAHQADRIAVVGETEGVVPERRRIAATDSITSELLAPASVSFLERNPNLAIDFLVSTENVDFSRWEADLAIRLTRPEKGNFIMSKLADFELYLFEPADAAADHDGLVVAYPEDLDLTPESRYLASIGLQQRARCTSKNLLVLKTLVESGRCRAVLPSYMCSDLMANGSLRFIRLPEPRSTWLLVQRHLRDDVTTRTVIDWIRDCFASVEASP